MESRFDHKAVEPRIYRRWEKSGFFNPDNLPRSHKKPFTIIMPPPNANGPLHIGHALFVTLQDLMIRFYRMRGRKTLWLPGADHAGFETQVVFDKKLEKEKRNRFEIPRDKLWQEIWDFTQANRETMENQLRELGASCDWSRNTFTLDPKIIKTTHEAFIQMYKDGLLYRGERIVNWCVKHQTTLSDLEVKYVERDDPLYYIKYGPLTLATVRPETKFGDTAVAVNPKDKRYKKYIGKEIEVETLIGKARMKVIADEAVDPEFGTGVIKVTPAHDPVDFEIGKRHNLEVREVIVKDGRLNEKTGPYAGLKVNEAREIVAQDMKKEGLLVKVDSHYNHSVATCYKCGTTLEPFVMPQWFVRMVEAPKSSSSLGSINGTKLRRVGRKSLRDMAVDAVKSGKITFIPKRMEKVFLHWMKNIRDWNISRQIVWGIRIPAWYCMTEELKDAQESGIVFQEAIKPYRSLTEWRRLFRFKEPVFVGTKPPQECPKCGENDLVQEPDVLDTWFSSGQWPYATLDYPKGKDYKTFYPTDAMETAADILFFWVARMIMLGLYRTGKIPFRTVYLHGIVRDKDWQKMSKSKGNVIDPLGVAEIYGVDALRMALTIGNMPGSDTAISEDKIRGYRNFTTKIWNASRFVISNYDKKLKTKPKYTKSDRSNLKKLKEIKQQITTDIEKFRFHHAGETAYHYFWHTFADKIIEEAKPRLKIDKSASAKAMADKAAAQTVLLEILKESLKMLHPFMPFVTEEIWGRLPHKPRNLLMIEKW
ncbi:MAG: valine--tRNA ligase [Candidatus Colwellbacteria bacterium]